MSLPPESRGIDEILERLEEEAVVENNHKIGEGFIEDLDVSPGVYRMECERCHEVAYVGPLAENVNPMNPGPCRGRVRPRDLKE